MTARVFISYRASDGVDKATALARDLDELFGGEQIFLDKDDLTAGARWRDEVAETFAGRPILLAVVTPDYLEGRDDGGALRIDDAGDPIRAELEAAIARDAHIVPLLADGVDALPHAARLPPPFDQLRERTWRRLRAYDWREDVNRLAGDLRALGVTERTPVTSPGAFATSVPQWPGPTGMPVSAPQPFGLLDARAAATGAANDPAATSRRRRRIVVGAALLATAAAGGWAAWRLGARSDDDLSGRWRARIGPKGSTSARDGQLVLATLSQRGDALQLASAPVDIEQDADWRDYRAFWKERTGSDLNRVVYRGEGRLLALGSAEPGGNRVLEIALRIEPAAGGEAIDRGSLRGTLEPDAQRVRGRLWMNSDQAERAFDLRRER